MTTRYVVIPELRMPFEDRTAWATVLEFIGDYRPDCVIQLGHLLNLPPRGRFTGQATTEFRRRELTHTVDYVRRHYLSRLRQVHNGPLKIICSAAAARLGTALNRQAVPEKAAATMYVERLVQLDVGEGIEVSTTYTLAPGWILLYGDTVAVAASDVPGNSALRIARHLGVSVIVGHTMRLGKGSYTLARADSASHTVTGVEIGHLIDQRRAKKLNGPSCGWRHGFTIVETHGTRVSATCVPLSANRTNVSWAGGPPTGDASGTRRQPVAACAVDRPAVGTVRGTAAPAPSTAPATSVGSALGAPEGRPSGNGGSGSGHDVATRVGGTSAQATPVGVEDRSERGAWWR